MNKSDYERIIKEEFAGQAQKIMLEQLEEFFDLKDKHILMPKYNVGNDVILPKETFLHGFGNNLDVFDDYATNGLISVDFKEKQKKRIKYVANLWHIHKKIKLADYIKFYSGMTFQFDWSGKETIVPYGKIDEFIESVRNKKYFTLRAESTMESRFMPCLQKDGTLPKPGESNRFDGCNQLAFIFNGRDKKCQKLLSNNLLNDQLPFEIVEKFMGFEDDAKREAFKANRKDGDLARIAYVLFGLPVNMLEGVLVGRIYEKDEKVLRHIKVVLPSCYICNIDGKVIIP